MNKEPYLKFARDRGYNVGTAMAWNGKVSPDHEKLSMFAARDVAGEHGHRFVEAMARSEYNAGREAALTSLRPTTVVAS